MLQGCWTHPVLSEKDEGRKAPDAKAARNGLASPGVDELHAIPAHRWVAQGGKERGGLTLSVVASNLAMVTVFLQRG